jgi:hypothetical protein
MAGNRKAFEERVLTFMAKLTKGGGNRTIYERVFATMDDKAMEAFIQSLENGGQLAVWASNFDPNEKLDYENLLKLCKEYGVEVEQQLVTYDEDTNIKSLSAHKAIVGRAEARKQRQMWAKKFSAASNDYEIDDLTGQPMGDSRATGLSGPEIAVLRTLGLHTMANELYNVKGGDVDALKSYKNDILTTGKTTTNGSLRKGSGTKVLNTVHHLFRGRHINTTIPNKA